MHITWQIVLVTFMYVHPSVADFDSFYVRSTLIEKNCKQNLFW